MSQDASSNHSPAQAFPHRRWLRWIIFLLLFGLISFLILVSAIGFEMVRPLPDYDKLPPVDAVKRYAYWLEGGNSNNPTTKTVAQNTKATSAPLLSVPPPWPTLTTNEQDPILKQLAVPLADLQTHLEVCRKDFEQYTTLAPVLDEAGASRRLGEFQKMVRAIDEERHGVRDRLQLSRNAGQTLDEIGGRINTLRDVLLAFRLDHCIRFGYWTEAGDHLFYIFRDWDRAVFYWRKSGPEGSLRIGEAMLYRLDDAFWANIGRPIENSFEDGLRKLDELNP